MSLREAVENGPGATAAKTAHIEARIRHAEARAKKAHDQAAVYRRKAKGDGPLAKYRKLQADGMDNVADQHRARANKLRTDLAKAEAAEAARNVKHVKRAAGTTAAEGLVPKTPGQVGPARGGQRQATCRWWSHDRGRCPRPPIPGSECCEKHHEQRYGKPDPRDRRPHPAGSSLHGFTTPQPKGTPAMSVSGEAVNIEQTRANLDQLKSQVTDVRGSFEATSGSLASGGLNQLAGSLASADDALDSVLTQIEAAEKHLSDQEAIAEAAQAAGEMHGDKSFYGA